MRDYYKRVKKELGVDVKALDESSEEFRKEIKESEAYSKDSEEKYLKEITDLSTKIDDKVAFYDGADTLWLLDYDRQKLAVDFLLEELLTAMTDKDRIEITKRLQMHIAEKQYIVDRRYGSVKPVAENSGS